MKLKRIKESYSDIDSSNAWDAYDLAMEYLGADELCEALAKAMGTDELASNLAYIFRMYEIPFGDDEDDEYDEDDEFEESVRKNRKIRKSMQEAGRMVNGRVSELSPQHDARKSFYGKAKVVTDSDGTQILYSYNTPVVEIKDDKVVLKPMWDSSATTLRHVKEFLKQNGFEVGSKAQLAKMYGGANESLRRSNRSSMYDEGCGSKKRKSKKRKSMKESEGQDRSSAYFDYQEYLDKFNAYCNQISNGELVIKGSVVKGDSFDEYILTVKDAYGSNEYVDIKLDYNWKDYGNAWTATVDYKSDTQDIYEDETSYSLDKLYKFVCDNLDLIVEDVLG